MSGRSYCVVLQAALLTVAIGGFAIPTASAQHKYWIEFRDKGTGQFGPGTAAYNEALHRFSAPAIARRVQEQRPLVSFGDIALYPPYLDSLTKLGIRPLRYSRWCNSVSAELSQAQQQELTSCKFVRAVYRVAEGKRLSAETDQAEDDIFCTYDPIITSEGDSYLQLARINVTPLQEMGLDATGVRLGFLDTGFRWRSMTSLEHANVEREYDYVFHDSVTANEDADVPDQDNHGSSTLSTAVGYDPGQHAGAAHNALLFLAKTEDLRSETPIEEDNWAQAIEDMERWGVQVASTSLGYMDFDSGWTSHTYADLNGHTTIAARAATHAGYLGVIVVNANGNNGEHAYPYLNTPADADSCLAVGALDESGARATFSSIGPTSDGRIKPDICAPGVHVHTQAVDGHYDFFGGTSYATPLVSSACCLIREAHPKARASVIRDAIRSTGSNASSPDNLIGWGTLNAYAAALEVGDIVHPIDVSYDQWLELCVGLASRYGVAHATIEYSSRTGGWLTQPLFRVTDSLIYSAQVAVDPNSTIKYRYVLTNGAGQTSFMPDTGYYEFTTGGGHELVIETYPNPTGNSATLLANEPGDWQLYDAAGRAVRSGEVLVPGSQSVSTENLADGAYFLVIRSRTGEIASRKLFVLH